MFSALIEFNTIPEIGFAHHFYTDNYCSTYKKTQKSFEIVYVKSGDISAELYGQNFYIPEKSVFVLFRHLPLTLRSVNNEPQSHCTVQAGMDYNFTLIDGTVSAVKENALLIPFLLTPCRESEEIKRDLFSIVTDISTSRSQNGFSAALKFLDILRKLDRIARNKSVQPGSQASLITYKTKVYIAKNLCAPISLSEIADELQLSPGHIDHVFKSEIGMPIKQYINSEKAKHIAELIQNQALSFKTACANAGITDTSYGYRLFKKHIGMTPGAFLFGDVHKKS